MKAFPVTKFNSHRVGHDGMDLRDYFAAKAMQVYLTATIGQTIMAQNVAENAYLMADAMLEARNK